MILKGAAVMLNYDLNAYLPAALFALTPP